MMAFCVCCRKDVEVVYPLDCDETGEVYEMPSCEECLTEISKCHECKKWIPDDRNTPLGETNGFCESRRRKVHAMDLICKFFKEEGVSR